jgi:DNA-binding Xre family transcriptional regulator
MPINWKLRELLKERGGNNAAKISRIVLEQTGYQLSTQAVCDLLNRQPKMIRLETIQALCDAFYIRVADFLEVLPSAAAQKSTKKTRSLEGQLRQTNAGESVQRALIPVATPTKKKVDFAAFYPDARKFSSDSIKVGGNIQSRKVERDRDANKTFNNL